MMRTLLLGAAIALSAPGGALAQAQPAAPAAESRGAPLADPLERRLVFLLERLEALERELRQVRGELEETGHQVEGVTRRQRELYLDLDRRLRELELGAVANAPAAPTAGADAPGEAPVSAPEQARPANGAAASTGGDGSPAAAVAIPPAAERQAYDQAFNLLKEGRYDRAIEAFGSFVASYPQSSYADNAQYWLGEANYVSRNYAAAAKEFQTVIDEYSDSTKVPDAVLKLGFTQYELKNWARARELLEQVVREYPDTTAASLAKTRLQRMRTEGH